MAISDDIAVVTKCFMTLVAFLLAQFMFAATPREAGDKKQSISKMNAEAVAQIEGIQKRYSTHKDAEQLKNDVEELLRLVKKNVLVSKTLNDAIEDSDNQAEDLLGALSAAGEILAFQPIMEAPIPEGFPEWTPVGEIRVNEYPAHRLAWVKLEGDEDRGFWTLFRHIETNNIAMTAPVSITYAGKQEDNPRGAAMAFLYQSTDIGKTGEQGNVEVIDAQRQLAVSVGMRGETTADTVRQGAEMLKAWFVDHADEFEPVGDLRTFGYNSPMVPAKQRYFEVQIPVREK